MKMNPLSALGQAGRAPVIILAAVVASTLVAAFVLSGASGAPGRTLAPITGTVVGKLSIVLCPEPAVVNSSACKAPPEMYSTRQLVLTSSTGTVVSLPLNPDGTFVGQLPPGSYQVAISIRRLALAACTILLLLLMAPLPKTPLIPTANAYTDGAGLDCNGWLGTPSDAPVKANHICADPIDPTTRRHLSDKGWYIGHDEPSLQFFSFSAGSANNIQYALTLPAVDPTPKQDGSQTANFENYITFWFSLSLCDPNSFPFHPCTPDSDSNNPTLAGSALLELQFYPPGWEPFISQISCNHTQWCAALNIDSLTTNNLCFEPLNFAFIQKNGIPTGPPGPGSHTSATFTPNANTLLMNPGDSITVTIKDNGVALETDVTDLTTSTSGKMVASAANGFANTNPATCATTAFDFRPEYSTADTTHITPWTALFANVNFAMEIGHFELGTAVSGD